MQGRNGAALTHSAGSISSSISSNAIGGMKPEIWPRELLDERAEAKTFDSDGVGELDRAEAGLSPPRDLKYNLGYNQMFD